MKKRRKVHKNAVEERRMLMAKYRCNVCGFVYEEEKEVEQQKPQKLDYQKEYVRHDETCRYME